jgi:hypothetical protein
LLPSPSLAAAIVRRNARNAPALALKNARRVSVQSARVAASPSPLSANGGYSQPENSNRKDRLTAASSISEVAFLIMQRVGGKLIE